MWKQIQHLSIDLRGTYIFYTYSSFVSFYKFRICVNWMDFSIQLTHILYLWHNTNTKYMLTIHDALKSVLKVWICVQIWCPHDSFKIWSIHVLICVTIIVGPKSPIFPSVFSLSSILCVLLMSTLNYLCTNCFPIVYGHLMESLVWHNSQCSHYSLQLCPTHQCFWSYTALCFLWSI
jgi:hypothetical protein